MTKRRLSRIIRGEEGITATEYGLIGSVVVTAILASLLLIGPRLLTMFKTVSGCFL